jgi:hypothetical protein
MWEGRVSLNLTRSDSRPGSQGGQNRGSLRHQTGCLGGRRGRCWRRGKGRKRRNVGTNFVEDEGLRFHCDHLAGRKIHTKIWRGNDAIQIRKLEEWSCGSRENSEAPNDRTLKRGKRKELREGRERSRIPCHGLSTLAHKIPSPHPTHEQSCHQILTRPDDHQARHIHS